MQTNPTEAAQAEIAAMFAMHGIRDVPSSLVTAFAEREARLVGALDRQCDNMAFVINHVNLHGFYDKFQAELEADRATLAALKDWTHG